MVTVDQVVASEVLSVVQMSPRQTLISASGPQVVSPKPLLCQVESEVEISALLLSASAAMTCCVWIRGIARST